MSQRKGGECSSASGAGSRARDVAAQAERKRYVRPVLQRYGALVDITAFGGSQLVDSGVGSLQNP